jgi:hypothetical protein
MQAEGQRSALLGVAKIVIEISALWAAFGYLSLRAFCNISGLPLIDDLSVQRYLEETYYIFISVADYIATDPFFLLALLLCCAISIAAFYIRKRRKIHTATARRWTNTVWVLPVWVLICSVGYSALSAYVTLLPQNLLVGKLVGENLQDRGMGHFYLSIALALFACCGAWLLQPPKRNPLNRPSQWSRRVLFAALWLLAVLSVMNIPILFGSSLANKVVHVVRLQADGVEGIDNSTCFAKILESKTQLLYWNWDAAKKSGIAKSVPVSKVHAIDYVRSAKLLDLANRMLQPDPPRTLCEDSTGSTK